MFELSAYLFIVTLFLGMALTAVAIRLGHRFGVLDHPGGRKTHAGPVPLTGGWAIFATLSIVFWGHLLAAIMLRGTPFVAGLPERVQHYASLAPGLVVKILPVYVGALAIFILGLVDDLRGMSAKGRLVAQTIVAGVLAAVGVGPQLGFLPGWLAAAVGIVWIVGITNAFNLLDGLDGLSTGVALVGTCALLTIMGIGNQPVVCLFLATVAGANLAFLIFNWHPAKAFLGSSGSLLIGYLLAVSSLAVTYMIGNVGNWIIPLLTPVFVLAIPIYDTTSVVLIRLIQKRSIAIGDQSHFHHRLMRLGFSHRQSVALIVLISFAIALSGVKLVNATLGQSALIVLQIAGIFAILILVERVAGKLRLDVLARRRDRRSADPLPDKPPAHE